MSFCLKPRLKGVLPYECNNSHWVWICEAGFLAPVGFMPVPGSNGDAYLLFSREGMRPDANDGFKVNRREAQLIGWLAAMAVDSPHFLQWSVKEHQWCNGGRASEAVKRFSDFCLQSGGFSIH